MLSNEHDYLHLYPGTNGVGAHAGVTRTGRTASGPATSATRSSAPETGRTTAAPPTHRCRAAQTEFTSRYRPPPLTHKVICKLYIESDREVVAGDESVPIENS